MRVGYRRPIRWSTSCCTTRAWKPSASRSMARAQRIDAAVADARVARHQAAQARHRQAALPAFLLVVADRLDHRIDQHRARHRRRVGVACIRRETEDHELQVDADLRRREAGAVGGFHGVEHVGDQGMQFGRCRTHAPARRCAAGAHRPSSGFHARPCWAPSLDCARHNQAAPRTPDESPCSARPQRCGDHVGKDVAQPLRGTRSNTRRHC